MAQAAGITPMRNEGFRSEMLAAGEIIPHRISVTVTRSRMIARRSTLSADVIPVWPDTCEEGIVWRFDNLQAIKRRRKMIRFNADDFEQHGPVIRIDDFEEFL